MSKTYRDVISYLAPSKGQFAMKGRTFSDGIINLGDSSNGISYDPTCEIALSSVVSSYYINRSHCILLSKLSVGNHQEWYCHSCDLLTWIRERIKLRCKDFRRYGSNLLDRSQSCKFDRDLYSAMYLCDQSENMRNVCWWGINYCSCFGSFYEYIMGRNATDIVMRVSLILSRSI